MLASTSVAAPGGYATTIVIGREGYVCARATRDSAGSVAGTRCQMQKSSTGKFHRFLLAAAPQKRSNDNSQKNDARDRVGIRPEDLRHCPSSGPYNCITPQQRRRAIAHAAPSDRHFNPSFPNKFHMR